MAIKQKEGSDMDQNSPPSGRDTGKEMKDRSLLDLLRDLARDIPELIRAEIAVIKAEIRGKASLAGQGAGLFIAAIIFLSMAIATGTALVIIVFDLFLPLWLAALIVMVLWLLIAAGLGLLGIQRFKKLSPDDENEPAMKATEDAASKDTKKPIAAGKEGKA
jgi:uncharacterized membrane protein YqjE